MSDEIKDLLHSYRYIMTQKYLHFHNVGVDIKHKSVLYSPDFEPTFLGHRWHYDRPSSKNMNIFSTR